MLLDNQSTTDIFCYHDFLTNIQSGEDCMTVHTNGGSLSTCQKCYYDGYGEVWYHPEAMTNILSMANVKKQFRVTYDSNGADRLTVHKPGRQIHFNCSPSVLYFHDYTNRDVTLVNTVAENKESFSQC